MNTLTRETRESDRGQAEQCITPPASVTEIADGYMLEMVRNILAKVQHDEGYKAYLDGLYQKRGISLHLRKFSVFATLPDEAFEEVLRQIRGSRFDELPPCDPIQLAQRRWSQHHRPAVITGEPLGHLQIRHRRARRRLDAEGGSHAAGLRPAGANRVGARLAQFFRRTVQVAHDRHGRDDRFALQLHHHAEHAMRAGVLRSEVERDQVCFVDDAEGARRLEHRVAQFRALHGRETGDVDQGVGH